MRFYLIAFLFAFMLTLNVTAEKEDDECDEPSRLDGQKVCATDGQTYKNRDAVRTARCATKDRKEPKYLYDGECNVPIRDRCKQQ